MVAGSLSAAIYTAVIATAVVLPLAGYRWSTGAEPLPVGVPLHIWLAAAMVGAVGFAAAFLPYACAITAIKAGPAAVIINLAPAFRVASAVLWLGETLTVQCIVGAALIAVSVMVFVPGRGNQLTRPGPLALPATVPAPPEQ